MEISMIEMPPCPIQTIMPLHFYVQYQNEKVNEPAATFPWTGSRGQKVILYYMIYHGLVTRHCPHTAVFRLRRVALSNNNLSRLPPILLAEAIVRLKDVDLRSSFLSAEQVMTGFANEKMMFDESLDHSWPRTWLTWSESSITLTPKDMTDLIRVCLTLIKSKSRWLHSLRFCWNQAHNWKDWGWSKFKS